ncbi:hypothetical protein E4U42_000999 [Claviceps africana]|uniref:Uncharacterized protein n=1 Tax=Claviceps africana TaxID=83212 RepID=A0A8K0JA79_9HYPO|nr:hypothetical protein E4U42_000999 [Claviceps africana]
MVKLPSLCLAVLPVFLPVATAGDCTAGLVYCGSTLLQYGDYQQRIDRAVGPNPPNYFQYKERSLILQVATALRELKEKMIYRPAPQAHTATATPVAIIAASKAAAGIRAPSMPMLVRVANMPPAGVKPPYM